MPTANPDHLSPPKCGRNVVASRNPPPLLLGAGGGLVGIGEGISGQWCGWSVTSEGIPRINTYPLPDHFIGNSSKGWIGGMGVVWGWCLGGVGWCWVVLGGVWQVTREVSRH